MPGDAAVAAVFEPVQPPTTFEETVERLGTAIRLGILGPGVRLPSERELAEQLGISRSTLRQAITTLVQSGHLTSVRGRGGGTFVVQEPPLAEGSPTGPVREDWREVLDLRVAIEVGTATLAADRASEEDLALMRECVDRMAASAEFDDYRRADIRFHMAIAEASGVPRLVGLVGEVEAEVSELIAHIAHPPEVLDHSNAEHARMIDALARHDATRGGAPPAPPPRRHAAHPRRPLPAGPRIGRSPVGHRRVEDAAEVLATDLPRADDEQALLLERAVHERGHVVLVVAELGDAARGMDVAHERAQDVGQGIRTRPPAGSIGSPASSSATRWWRPGAAS